MKENLAVPQRKGKPPGDEIDITRLFLILWDHKAWIIGCTSAITLIGLLYASLAEPVYYSEATIALKESGKGNDASRIFSQFGGAGGAFASQLGVGNTNLIKITIILQSEELAESVIVKKNLMPLLYRKAWDSNQHTWKTKDPKKAPTLRMGALLLGKRLLQVNADEKKGILRLGVSFFSPSLAKEVVDGYLAELNNRIRLNTTNDADSNRLYLERQLNNISDPVLIEKIQNLISTEIEKSMLMSSRAFEVLENPLVPLNKSYPKRSLYVILSFLVGIVLSVGGVFLWGGVIAFKKAVKDAKYRFGGAHEDSGASGDVTSEQDS